MVNQISSPVSVSLHQFKRPAGTIYSPVENALAQDEYRQVRCSGCGWLVLTLLSALMSLDA